jgi:hypothetical protein
MMEDYEQQNQDDNYLQILDPLSGDDFSPEGEDKPLSAVKLYMESAIENIFNEAEILWDAGTTSAGENLAALGRALQEVDIDVVDARINIGPSILDGSRSAKLQVVELLYEDAKRLSQREMTSLVYYLSELLGEVEDQLLSEAYVGDDNYFHDNWLDPVNMEDQQYAKGGEDEFGEEEGEQDDEVDLRMNE